MNPMPQHANHTLDVAKETLALSEKSGDRTLKIIGMAMLAVTGLATMLHAGHAIYRDLFATKGKGGRGDPVPPRGMPTQASGANTDTEPADKGAVSERSWVHKAKVTKQPHGEKRWAEHASGHGRPRLH